MKTRELVASLLQQALETDDDDLLEEAIAAGRELDAADHDAEWQEEPVRSRAPHSANDFAQ